MGRTQEVIENKRKCLWVHPRRDQFETNWNQRKNPAKPSEPKLYLIRLRNQTLQIPRLNREIRHLQRSVAAAGRHIHFLHTRFPGRRIVILPPDDPDNGGPYQHDYGTVPRNAAYPTMLGAPHFRLLLQASAVQ